MSEKAPSGAEELLQRFHAQTVCLSGDEEWLAGKTHSVAQSAVEKIVSWAYESSRGLFPSAPVPVGSFVEKLHLPLAGGASHDFDFLVPVRYNPRLALRSGSLSTEPPGSSDPRLPTYIFRNAGFRAGPDRGLPVFRWGTRVLVDTEDLGEADVKVYCEKPIGQVEDEEEDYLEWDKLDKCQESLSHHNLDPDQILKDFHRCVEIALNPAYTHPRQNDPVFQHRLFPSRVPRIDNRMRENIKLEALDLSGPIIQLAFHEGNKTVPVKLVPAIRGAIELSNQWIRDDLTHLSDWWDGDLTNEKKSFLRKVEAVKEVGPELIPKGGFWRLSFSCAEAVILENVDSDGGQRRKALQLLKFVNMTRWTPEYGKILTSFHLKTILLWCCEIYHHKEHWETLLCSLQKLLWLLTHALATEKLPHYFLQPVNLFSRPSKTSTSSHRSLALEALRHEASAILADPVAYLMPGCESPTCPVSEGYKEKRAALQEFKERHQEEWKELKRMEGKHMYEEVETTEK